MGPSPASGVHFDTGTQANFLTQIHRVQSANYSFDITRLDVNEFDRLAAIDRVIVEAPTVNLDFSYLLTNGDQEEAIGFVINGQTSSISGILTKASDEKNYFILTTPEGSDAADNTDRANHSVFAIGNGFISNYSMEAAVGGLPTATVTVEALNIQADAQSSGAYIPAVNVEDGSRITGVDFTYVIPVADDATGLYSALRPGDISFELKTPFGAKLPGEFQEGTAHIQSFNIDIPIAREPLQRLGSSYAFSREITFPVTVSMTITANLSDIKTGNLADIICLDEDYDLAINMNEPSCAGQSKVRAMRFELRGAKLDNQSFTSSIGANKSVDLTFSAQIGAAEDITKGLFISGNKNN